MAKNYALRTSGKGVIMEVTVPKSSTVTSPSTKNINLRQLPGVKINEFDVLLRGRVSGASTARINQ